jgi:response regulator of citrate/malate metabolism
MEAQRQEQLAKEAEAAQKRLDEINKIMPANEQSEQSGFDMTVDILVKVYKALTDQTDTLERAIKQID